MQQLVVVTLLVVACALNAAWLLAPAALRRRVAGALLAVPWPRSIERRLRAHAEARPGCTCDGCDRAPGAPTAPSEGKVAPITFHPRSSR